MADENAVYWHGLPCERGHEVTNDVVEKTEGAGLTSSVFNQAKNRMVVEKAVMNLVL